MSHIQDDDPPIKTGVASKEYKENWERIFGDASGSSHDVEARQVAPAPDAPAEPAEPDAWEEFMRERFRAACTQDGWNGVFHIDEDD
mgnify:CR=1 FL=1